MVIWNPWHGCKKISPGCANCYVYRRDNSIGRDASIVTKTGDFYLPLKKNRQGNLKIKPEDGIIFTCMTSDFFLEEADQWRQDCWDIIRQRQDLSFYIITKRIERFSECIPPDWNDGWDNVTICCTCENQDRADHRLPIFLNLPIKHREMISEPMLEEIDIKKYLQKGLISCVICGGESGAGARPCDFKWIKKVRMDCIRCGVAFTFKQTGAVFIKDGKTYHIDRKNQMPQARKSGYDYIPGANIADNIIYKLPDRNKLFERIGRSNFRSRFRLLQKEKDYISKNGMETIKLHAKEFVKNRLAAESPKNDGEQTPMKGHPVFIAQHATACCCRGCLEKWHNIPAGKTLTTTEQDYIVDVIMEWIDKNID